MSEKEEIVPSSAADALGLAADLAEEDDQEYENNCGEAFMETMEDVQTRMTQLSMAACPDGEDDGDDDDFEATLDGNESERSDKIPAGTQFHPAKGSQVDMGSISSTKWKQQWILLRKWKPANNAVCLLHFDEDPIACKEQTGKGSPLMGCVELKGATVSIIHRDEFARVGNYFYWGLKPAKSNLTIVFACSTAVERKLWIRACCNPISGGRNYGKLPTPQKLFQASWREGWMMKMAEKPKTNGWKVRYFVVHHQTREILYFKTKRASSKLGGIKLTGAVCKELGEMYGRSSCFSLKTAGGREYILAGHDSEDVSDNIAMIEQLAGMAPALGEAATTGFFKKSLVKLMN